MKGYNQSMNFKPLPKLKQGDKVAIVSPSFAAPGQWPHVYELALERVRNVFGLEPVAFPATAKLGATWEERSRDLIASFEQKEIKAVIASIGGDDQVTYIKKLGSEPFSSNPKPFLGYSDNSHFANHLWLNGVPSYYGASLFTQFGMQQQMHEYTVEYIRYALFDTGEFELKPFEFFNEIGLDWNDPATLHQARALEPSEGWKWSGKKDGAGYTWGGCLESIDEMLRHDVPIPTLDHFSEVILVTETSEEIPSHEYVRRVYRALGERGILERIQGVLVGRPKAWEFNNQQNADQRREYRHTQRETIEAVIREYNPTVPIVQNLEFGHTDPQFPIPYGGHVRILATEQKIFATF